MKRKLHFWIALLAIALASCVVNTAWAAKKTSGYCGAGAKINNPGQNITWNYNPTTKTLTLTGTGAMMDYNTNTQVQNSKTSSSLHYQNAPWYNDYTIYGSGAVNTTKTVNLDYNSAVEHLVIGEGITRIGDNAFMAFNKLQTVSLPSSLQEIGRNAFYLHANIETATAWANFVIPENVTLFEEVCFQGCRMNKDELVIQHCM